MAANSSCSSRNDSHIIPDCLSFTDPLRPGLNLFIFTAYITTVVLLLVPLFVLVLYLGFQRWRQKRSASSSAVTTSHSDSFAYHMASIELLGVLGFILNSCDIYRRQVATYSEGFFLLSVNWFGQTLFHILTCVERYLAVVHPVTYLSLRTERGIRIRNISIGGVWLLCLGGATMEVLGYLFISLNFFIVIFSLAVVSFCSISVLRVLIRPGPGGQGGDRVDQSKRRAFYTIGAILGVLLLRCAAGLAWAVLHELGKEDACEFISFETWANVLTSLVLPLLFLHRAGRLPCCKNSKQ